ncbi:MAG: glycoside hydrolase family 3 protein [Candidatus Cyclobacteriaceae bacterium M2_1C_046]
MHLKKEAKQKNNMFDNISRKEKIGQLFSPAVFINGSKEHHKDIEELIIKHHIGGLTFFHSPQSAAANYGGNLKPVYNENSLDLLKELIQHFQSISKYPLLISIDAEWGLAMRVENTPKYPYAITLGALSESNNNLVYLTGYNIGIDCLDAGIHLNLAPVADINENPANPVIGYRSFGERKHDVTSKSLSFYKGLSDTGVVGCLKHFPGHGNTTVDSHLGLPVINNSEEELFNNELLPFIEGIHNGVECIMVGHLAVPALTEGESVPASLSSKIINGLLRKQLGFNGVVISDALNMRSVADIYEQKGRLELEAFKAGNDLLCFSNDVPEAIDLINEEISEDYLNSSFNRIMNLKMKATQNLDKFNHALPSEELKQKIAIGSITLYSTKNSKEANPIKNFSYNRTAMVSINKNVDNKFSKTINKFQAIPQYEILQSTGHRLQITKNSLLQYEQLIFAIYVPSMKPHDNYGFEQVVLNFLNEIFSSVRCIVCLFGNPYAINCIKGIDNAENVVLAYEDLPEFEEKAAEFLFGKFKPVGNLPVTVKPVIK